MNKKYELDITFEHLEFITPRNQEIIINDKFERFIFKGTIDSFYHDNYKLWYTLKNKIINGIEIKKDILYIELDYNIIRKK